MTTMCTGKLGLIERETRLHLSTRTRDVAKSAHPAGYFVTGRWNRSSRELQVLAKALTTHERN